jgi:hypothetical protein
METVMQRVRWLAVILGAMTISCGEPPPDADPDNGPIENILSFENRVSWPGSDQQTGRKILSLRGFAEQAAIGYWFFGFGAQRTDDVFFFCREGDTACPLDEHRRLAWDHLVGHPVFTRIPGDPEFSPFWQMWVVRVPEDYEPDTVKTIPTLDRLAQAGELRAERFILDFQTINNEVVGPREVILHCALSLTGSELALKSLPQIDDLNASILTVPLKFGWFTGHRVEFFDFSVSEGVFPASAASESRAIMRMANVYITWRDCNDDPRPEICDVPGYAFGQERPVSERGLAQDFTGNRTAFDTNNVFGSSPCSLKRPSTELTYSPLWSPRKVIVSMQTDLIDTYLDPTRSVIQSADDVFATVETGGARPPVIQMEDETGNPVLGNGGRVMFDCPFTVLEDFVPYPCEANL